MRFFNMDLHISLIADIKNILEKYVEIVDWCMSGHSWVLKRDRMYPKHINPDSWTHMDKEMIKQFQDEYDSFLRTFDGFIVAYPGSFAMIFEKYNKPIIMVNAVRYDLPFCWSKKFDIKDEYNACLKRLNDSNRLFVISNNLADQAYMLEGSGVQSHYIPSLCLYTNMKYSATDNNGKFLCYTGSTGISHPLVVPKHNIRMPFDWSDIASFRGIIHFPYEISTMSMFEQFSARIPLFFPSKKYMHANVSIQSTSAYWKENDCPYEKFRDKQTWLDLADMYNVFNKSPNVYFFDTVPHLFHLLETFEWKDDSDFFKNYFDDILLKWKHIIDDTRFYKIKRHENRHLCYNRIPLLANVMYDTTYEGSGVKAQHNYETKNCFTKGDVVFVKTDLLAKFLTHVLPSIGVDFILVTGVSDCSPTPEQAEYIINNPRIVQWIGCNILQTHEKILKIPIGVGEPERINGNHQILLEVHAQRVHFNEKLYPTICIPYHGSTHTSRGSIKGTMLPKLDFRDYMNTIKDYRFVLSLRGNGVDTHRFCEILLMGSVPVIEHSGLDDMYNQFPCCFIGETESFIWDENKFKKFLNIFWLNKLN